MATLEECTTRLDELKTAMSQVKTKGIGADELRSIYREVVNQKDGYKAAGVNMRSYTKIVGDARDAIGYVEAGSGKNKKRLALGATGVLAIGLIGGYVAPGLFKSSGPETPEATRYNGDLAMLEPNNAKVSIRIKNGKSSFSLRGRQESGDFAAASRKTRGNAKIHIDTRGELSFGLSGPNDPNDMNFAFEGNRNGAHAVFNGTQKGDYKARIRNKGPPKCRNNLGR